MFLVQYQIGNRGGTGGTSGVNYLKETIKYMCNFTGIYIMHVCCFRNVPMFFPDLINMTSFFILKEYIPKL